MASLLVVDDDPDLLVLLEAHYRVRGHAVAAASSCQDGLASAARGRPDVILLDFCMPKMDGARFIQLLRGDPLTKDVPVIVMSAASSAWIAAKLTSEPRVRIIEKPFDFAELDPLIDELVSHRAA